MKHVLYAFMLLGLFACQKENHNEEEQNPEPTPPTATVCKVTSLREYPAVDGNSIVRTFTYDDKNRVVKMNVEDAAKPAVTKTISYNAANLIDTIRHGTGAFEAFSYTNGVLSSWELFDAEKKGAKKITYTYEGGKLVREDHYTPNAESGAYALSEYLLLEWDANSNIAAIKTFTPTGTLKAADTYTYHAQLLNKQQTMTPQMHLMFMNWSNDITAFVNSKYLLTQVTSKSRNLVYETNEGGFVTKIKTDKKNDLFLFTYGCN